MAKIGHERIELAAVHRVLILHYVSKKTFNQRTGYTKTETLLRLPGKMP
jgi:hypothetical protein